jgi:DUF177 domain-containing protein
MIAHEFSVAARDLDAAGKPFRFPIRAAWLRGALEGTNVLPGGTDGELDLRLSKSGTDVIVRGTVTAELTVECARCLQPTRVLVREPLSGLFVPTGDLTGPPSDEEELTADQADVMPYDGETVVLDDFVRDELLLGVPMIPLCSESCPGIRPQTSPESASKAIDPRLSPLLRLKKSTT